MWAPNFGPVLIYVSALTVYSDSVAVPQRHRVQSADMLPYGHELAVLHFQSPPSQLMVVQAVDEFHFVSVHCQPHTQTAECCWHATSAQCTYEKYTNLKYEVTLWLDHSGCCQERPSSLQPWRNLLLSFPHPPSDFCPPFLTRVRGYHYGIILELKMFVGTP